MSRISISILLFLLASLPAEGKECSLAEAQAAENATDTLDSWPSIFAAYQRYGHCDDGAIAEGFTDKVVHLLATQWGSLSHAQQFIARDPSFQVFLVRHVNASADTSELDRIVRFTSRNCPASAKFLCKQIAGAASER